MSVVVLRCPACGTTQSQPGECDACSEAQVRYFCNNHTPGLWLDAAVCTACGARFGDAPRSRPAPTPPRAAPKVPARETPRRPASRPPPLAGGAETPRRDSEDEPIGTEPEDTSGAAALAELLVRSLEDRDRARREEEVPPREPTERPPSRGLPVGGCLGRLMLLVLLVIVLGVGSCFQLIGFLP